MKGLIIKLKDTMFKAGIPNYGVSLIVNITRYDGAFWSVGGLGWFRKMAVCAEQYERCGEGQNYKYLNPYGIGLSDEGEVLFLDTESRENAEVMKQMQKRAVRSHFIRPVYEMDTCGSREPDLFGYGNTLRFMLAYMKVVPALTKREEIRLFRICGKCIGETRM